MITQGGQPGEDEPSGLPAGSVCEPSSLVPALIVGVIGYTILRVIK